MIIVGSLKIFSLVKLVEQSIEKIILVFKAKLLIGSQGTIINPKLYKLKFSKFLIVGFQVKSEMEKNYPRQNNNLTIFLHL